MKAAGLKPSDVSNAYNQLLNRLAKRTVRHAHWQLHGALALAVKWGPIPVNVAAQVDPPEPDVFEGRALNREDMASLLVAVRSHALAPRIILAIDSSARQGESLTLRWADLGVEAGLSIGP